MARKSETSKQAITKFKKQVQKYMKKDLDDLHDYLLSVIKGEEKEEQYDPKEGKLITRAMPHSTRIQAVKMYKDLFVDKLIPDTKHVVDESEGLDHAKELEELRKAIQVDKAEKAKEKGSPPSGGGKVVNFPGDN